MQSRHKGCTEIDVEETTAANVDKYWDSANGSSHDNQNCDEESKNENITTSKSTVMRSSSTPTSNTASGTKHKNTGTEHLKSSGRNNKKKSARRTSSQPAGAGECESSESYYLFNKSVNHEVIIPHVQITWSEEQIDYTV